MSNHRHQSAPLLQLAAVLSLLLVSASLPSPVHARGIFTRPHPLLNTKPVSPSQPAALPAGVPAADVAVLPDGPVDDSIESLLGDTSKLQLTAEVASAASLANLSLPVAQKFQAWTRKHNKQYSGAVEKVKRLLAFAANLAYVEAHNLKHPDERLRLNEFSDMSFNEFRAAFLAPPSERFNLLHWLAGNGGKAAPVPSVNDSAAAAGGGGSGSALPGGRPGPLGASVSQLPSSFDWTSRKVVGVARNQGTACGEWTIARVGQVSRRLKNQGFFLWRRHLRQHLLDPGV